jgi:hypothetical protein
MAFSTAVAAPSIDSGILLAKFAALPGWNLQENCLLPGDRP